MTDSTNKGGAPKGNTNAMKHGSRSKICRGGKLRDGERHVENVRNKWLRKLETEVADLHGEVSTTHQLTIESIGDYLVQKMTLQRRYRSEKKIDLKDQVLLMETIQKSNQEILKLVKKLGLEESSTSDDDDDWEIDVS